ncbi:motile sperm domain-containing protein 1-like isoform X2 [Penaeus chinensis]|uniref:motile sperm domain-containing protein 1-like isoform X2 n=1 Tax=Penaeus chinensis TaxID=139456 RepID=UPI001FB6FDBB|nr:motile sperm domain-containing protein 1-like isoform X2 [Penaeus chinensis]
MLKLSCFYYPICYFGSCLEGTLCPPSTRPSCLSPPAKPTDLCLESGYVVMQPSGLDGRLPVFVFPPSVTVYLADPSTHKQIVTLYNPYDFTISYQVLCNAPNRYTVDTPHGVIRAKRSVDIIVRHIDVSLSNVQTPDKLRIQITEEGKRQVLGRKDIPVTLVKGVPEARSGTDSDCFESVHAPSSRAAVGAATSDTAQQHQRQHAFGANQGNTGPSLVLVSAAVVCLLGLLMPTEGDQTPTRIPQYLHLNTNIKIVLAYVLGLLTYAILRVG